MLACADSTNSYRRVLIRGEADIHRVNVGILDRFCRVVILLHRRKVHLLAGATDVSLDSAEIAGKFLLIATDHGCQFRAWDFSQRFEVGATHEAETEHRDPHQAANSCILTRTFFRSSTKRSRSRTLAD